MCPATFGAEGLTRKKERLEKQTRGGLRAKRLPWGTNKGENVKQIQ